MQLAITAHAAAAPVPADIPAELAVIVSDLVGFLRAEATAPMWGEPPADGAYVVIGDAVYQRADRVGRAPEGGDWYRLDGTDGGYGPLSYTEIAFNTDDLTDRPTTSRGVEQLYTMEDLLALIRTYTAVTTRR
ncbi:hypothetical protein [Dactylosporangium sp. CS-033363]|uniref:hypothetical protein n=1 Tax=Dactylosporangium sp. CS-033363 TaxID=3239935 RepID=UPI003D8FB98A